MRGLLHLLRTDGAMVEADLHAFYGVDLVDMYRGRLSLRKVGVLVRHLPGESRTVRHLSGDGPHWSLEAVLLDDLRMAMTSSKKHPAKPHPLRKKAVQATRRKPDENRRKAFLRSAARRAAELVGLTDEEGE